jgi:ethanolamine ammonia-lyase small subunit
VARAPSELPSEAAAPGVTAAPWSALRRHTPARIALGRAGHSLPTAAHLDFQLAHAQARDAVHLGFDVERMAADVQVLRLPVLCLHSAAADRGIYLQRPDLGRRLGQASRQQLLERRAALGPARPRHDLAFVVADGLSSLAVQQHAAPLLVAITALLAVDNPPWSIAPLALVAQGRVAVGDEVGELLDANTVVVLIGERPGLSSPDSMGLYLTWAPRPGLTDEARNCISNVRPAGLAPDVAAPRLHYLLTQARQRRLSGVALKDETEIAPAPRLRGDGAPANLGFVPGGTPTP